MTLYIFAGLPGAGKSTLSRHLARQVRAVYLRIDTIEAALRAAGVQMNGPEGYTVAYQVAADNLQLGMSVVADSVNPLQITRAAWRAVADGARVPFIQIEVICSDQGEHRRRVESRTADIPGFRLPTWDEVVNRKCDPWDSSTRIVIDTAGQTPRQSLAVLEHALAGRS